MAYLQPHPQSSLNLTPPPPYGGAKLPQGSCSRPLGSDPTPQQAVATIKHPWFTPGSCASPSDLSHTPHPQQ